MTLEIPNSLKSSAARRGVVVLAGAGLSAGRPSALPGWKPVNAAIMRELARRLETSLGRREWLAEVTQLVDQHRDADRFPPDYQAQLIEEMCGDRYFRALQALDVDAVNSGHLGIAALAEAGALRAIVTTNFDRLIEKALETRGVEYSVAYDESGFLKMRRRLAEEETGPLPLIKIHGCVSDHRSLIDTLKQRKRMRSARLQNCLNTLRSEYWTFLGFSAADLETTPDYLGLVSGAVQSSGATFVAYPGHPQLGRGAQLLVNAHGDRATVVVADIAAYIAEVCAALGHPTPPVVSTDNAAGSAQFATKLQAWADELSPAAAGLSLAAILEAVGEAEPAVRILDRLVRKELYDERDTDDFRALQLHYGRLGGAWGRFVAVPDMNGVASNASVETTQSLLRIKDSEIGFAARAWLTTLWLWLGDGANAMGAAFAVMKGVAEGLFDWPQPRNDEEIVDAWLAAAQVFAINSHEITASFAVELAPKVLALARETGDVVRVARVAAAELFAYAETSHDVPALAAKHEATFNEAARVGDAFAAGMRALALGRWHVGVGGLALAAQTDITSVSERALSYLSEAITAFERQGMDPWRVLAVLLQAKALARLNRIDDAEAVLDVVVREVERFPIFRSHLYEIVAQIHAMCGNDESAWGSLRRAGEAAQESGLFLRSDTLLSRLQQSGE